MTALLVIAGTSNGLALLGSLVAASVVIALCVAAIRWNRLMAGSVASIAGALALQIICCPNWCDRYPWDPICWFI